MALGIDERNTKFASKFARSQQFLRGKCANPNLRFKGGVRIE